MKVKIVYSTQGGTTKYIAQQMVKALQEIGHSAELHCAPVDGFQPAMDGCQLLIFGSPTYDEGQLEAGMALLTTEFQPDLSQYHCAAFAVGDSSFPHYCGAAEVLEQWITQHQGTLVVPVLKIDSYRQDFSMVPDWIKQVVAAAESKG